MAAQTGWVGILADTLCGIHRAWICIIEIEEGGIWKGGEGGLQGQGLYLGHCRGKESARQGVDIPTRSLEDSRRTFAVWLTGFVRIP